MKLRTQNHKLGLQKLEILELDHWRTGRGNREEKLITDLMSVWRNDLKEIRVRRREENGLCIIREPQRAER